MQSVVLLGFMGSGKSTIGQSLAKHLGINLLDTDQIIESKMNMSIPMIFEVYGEGYFRDLENQVIKNLDLNNQVIATGGGIVEREVNRHYLASHFITIYLDTKFETVIKRLNNDQSRPLWRQPIEKRKLLFSKRQQLYSETASLTIQTDFLTVEEIVHQIISQLNL